jgi:replicative DNA helicase
MGPERKLLVLMVKDREWVERVAEQVGPDDFQDRDYRAIFEALLDDPELSHPPEGLDPSAVRLMEGLMSDPEELSQTQRVFEESLGRIRSGSIQVRLTELDRVIRETVNEEQMAELLTEKKRLVDESREYGIDWGRAARRTINMKSDDDKGNT